MGRFNGGILGAFTGKVGAVIGSTWRDINVMRGLPKLKKRRTSDLQAIQQLRFKLAGNFINSIRELVMDSFQLDPGQMNGANAAVRYTLKNAIIGEYPDLEIDYSKVLVSKGKLTRAFNASAVAGNASVVFNWTAVAGLADTNPNDELVLVVYHAASNEARFTIGSALRSAGTVTVQLPTMVGQEVHTWVAFRAENGKLYSESNYTGKVTIAA